MPWHSVRVAPKCDDNSADARLSGCSVPKSSFAQAFGGAAVNVLQIGKHKEKHLYLEVNICFRQIRNEFDVK